jgi:hypothetical protein
METTHRNKCEAGTSPQAIQKILEIVIEVRCPFREESSWREELGKSQRVAVGREFATVGFDSRAPGPFPLLP